MDRVRVPPREECVACLLRADDDVLGVDHRRRELYVVTFKPCLLA